MRKGVVVLLVFALLFSALTAYMSFFEVGTIHARAVTGAVNLYISGAGPTIFIHSPLNTTYNFAIGSNYTLDLNVSTPTVDVDVWFYTLDDLFHETTVVESIPFTPNTTFNAVRRSNRLTVYVNDSFGETNSKSVIFYVSVPNSAPLLGNITSSLHACEASSLSYAFNATDVDEGDLLLSVSPASPFFVFPNSFSGDANVTSELFSGTLEKSDVGQYNRTISVTDGQYSDSKNLTIDVIEINNAPFIEPIGIFTVYTQGYNTSFFKKVEVTDVEDGDSNSGNLTFNISFNGEPKFFNISHVGNMQFEANASLIGVHNLTVCVTDRNLTTISPNISLCSDDGLMETVCSNFSITVTDENRPPTIVTQSPIESSLNATGGDLLTFNISTFDPDGTIPDIRWFRDGGVALYVQNSYNSQYLVSYPCGVSGLRTIEAVITDGLANDSVSWNVSVTELECSPTTTAEGGGGGGGGGPFCAPKWGCDDWSVCQHTQSSLEIGTIGQLDYREITESCAAMGLDERTCGYQTRGCIDGATCDSIVGRPSFVQSCPYTSNPSCNDGMKNCHDGSCELLVDCGGPCGQCASCSDGLQNQGELDIDCGGPCPFACPAQTPLIKPSTWRTITVWTFWIVLLILFLVLLRRIWRLIEVHRELQKERRIQSALSR